MALETNTSADGYRARAAADDPAYKHRVAEPVMAAIDAMSKPFRELVHEFGYVDVYRAWKRGMQPDEIRRRARDGTFTL